MQNINDKKITQQLTEKCVYNKSQVTYNTW